MEKKKILFFIESLQCGGAEKSFLSLLNSMDYSNYDVTLKVFIAGGAFEKFVPSNIKIENIDFKPNLIDRIKFKLFKIFDVNKINHPAQLFWKSINKRIPVLDEKYDIAISWGQGFATYFVSKKVNALKKYAWVNIDYQKAGYNWKKDVDIYENFDTIVGVSDFVKESMQKFIKKEKVISIRNIIDPDEITSRGEIKCSVEFDKNQINLVSVGRLAKQKGFELAIRACNILVKNKHNVHLYIVGEGSERPFLESEIKKYNLDNHCTLLGFSDNPYPFIKQSDIYIQSSWFEGLGRTIIEAGILCKPIVTTDFPTAYSILNHEKTGLICTMTPEAIGTSIERLITDNDLKNTLIDNLIKQEDKEKVKTLTKVDELLNS